MGKTKIKKGLNLPIKGDPEQKIYDGKKVSKVAVIGDDYVGMKPTMAVQVGDTVKLGQLLFTDKKMKGVKYTSPGAGKVIEINRGQKRHFESLVIELEGNEEETFESYNANELPSVDEVKIKTNLIESGLWTGLRARPFSKVANPADKPRSIFISAMDTNPLAPSVEKVLEGRESDFINGLIVISKLTDGKLFLCKEPGLNIPTTELDQLAIEEFEGPHPAGLPGTHIHFLDPVGRNKIIWYINAQDVAAIGSLFITGKINVDRIVSVAGPGVKNPRLIKTRLGASVEDLLKDELIEEETRVISGSVFSGFKADNTYGYLGRYHQQISIIKEEREKKFLGWLTPGFNKHSVKPLVFSKLLPGKKLDLGTSTNGSERAIVPFGSYEKVMPLDILPTYLLRALAVDDVEEAEKLGCLELDEEDLALCTYVCQSKVNHGINLRRNLTLIEKEG
ncbi:MAG: Na(+)-translocating NADH-quinone reductase subunit A [Ignavibacteria bacterium]|jgi:Na+-transporting NADH:ubiquinone oxidoreductase subunit A